MLTEGSKETSKENSAINLIMLDDLSVYWYLLSCWHCLGLLLLMILWRPCRPSLLCFQQWQCWKLAFLLTSMLLVDNQYRAAQDKFLVMVTRNAEEIKPKERQLLEAFWKKLEGRLNELKNKPKVYMEREYVYWLQFECLCWISLNSCICCSSLYFIQSVNFSSIKHSSCQK